MRNSPESADIGELKRRATNLRRHMLTMRGRAGYIGQGLAWRTRCCARLSQ